LIDIARFLELDLVLVPKSMTMTVGAILDAGATVQNNAPLYSLDDVDDEDE